MNDELQFANIKLDEQTMTKTIAYLVIQVSNLQKENADNVNRIHELQQRIDKAIKFIEMEVGIMPTLRGGCMARDELTKVGIGELYEILKGDNND